MKTEAKILFFVNPDFSLNFPLPFFSWLQCVCEFPTNLLTGWCLLVEMGESDGWFPTKLGGIAAGVCWRRRRKWHSLTKGEKSDGMVLEMLGVDDFEEWSFGVRWRRRDVVWRSSLMLLVFGDRDESRYLLERERGGRCCFRKLQWGAATGSWRWGGGGCFWVNVRQLLRCRGDERSLFGF